MEEVSLPADAVEILGRLDDFPTVTGDMVVTPIVGWITELPELVAAPDEVARIFSIPISALMERDRWVIKEWERNGTMFPVYYFDWDGETLWGLSAYITLQLLALLPEGPPLTLPKPYAERE